ncbi:MAG: hypothetical protein ABIH41_06935, partial [Nanoarchaeota archaeon]
RGRKNWRPTIVAFCGNQLNRVPMFYLLDWISSNRGIMKMYYLMHGDIDHNAQQRDEVEKEMKQYVKENDLELYPRVVFSQNFESTFDAIIQSETIASLPLNTVLFDYNEFFKVNTLLPTAVRLRKNVIILRNQAGFADFKSVDVWWNTTSNGNFMLMLAYLITHSKKWKDDYATIRLLKIVETQAEQDETTKALQTLINNARIENILLHVLIRGGKAIEDNIYEESKYCDLAIMGVPNFQNRKSDAEIDKNIKKYTDRLKTTLIVHAHDKIDFRIN